MSGPQGVLLGVASDPWVTQTVPQVPKWSPRPPKYQVLVAQITFSSLPVLQIQPLPASPASPASLPNPASPAILSVLLVTS